MALPLLVPAILALAPPSPPALVPVLPTQKALDLLKEGKVDAALAQLDEAIARDPKDIQPFWIKAQVHRELAKQTKGWASAWHKECAEESAESLLDLGPDRNAISQAMSFLQHLRDDERPVPPEPTAAALKAFDEGEAAFGKEDWTSARTGYAKALKESPAFAKAALYLGDTWFAEKRMEEAIPWFRRAAELDPSDPRAWRFLADAETALGRKKEAEATMIAAIRVFPANRASWQPLSWRRTSEGRPMARLAFKPGVVVGWDRNGKQTISLASSEDPQATAIWLVLASAVLDTITVSGDTAGSGDLPELKTRFQQERFYWNLALKAYREACAQAKTEPRDRILKQFLAFQQEGQLDAALFLLRYREAFRPDYEAWVKANPGAIERFINRYNLRP
ncbi:tetratricopeptide repeat protein [Geothrix terrae]|uniref:tetratricopeptide repeat protein n=1 Tax=Geothrix terrae TaxID=2922720 RepID=UPI001FADE1CB|nr:tetratricopeptide repeat protein [Geothrix terrae]